MLKKLKHCWGFLFNTYFQAMKKILVIIALFSTVLSNAQEINPTPIQSEFLKEERAYKIHLPYSYSDTLHAQNEYPVLLLLDGYYHFWYTVNVLSFLSSHNVIPEFIVVAVPNTDRTRDLTPTHSIQHYNGKDDEDFLKTSGGGENFLNFINKELMPKIDEDYNTMKLKVFVGHSFGGLTATQSFLSNSSPFNAYISMDPSLWWDNRLCVEQLKTVKSLSNTKAWFMSGANNSDDKVDTSSTREALVLFNDLLQKQPNTLRTAFKIYENDSHNSVTLSSLNDGIRFLFNSYRITNAMRKDVVLFKAHFKQQSEEWGEDFNPSQVLINNTAYACLRNKELDNALAFFKYNVELYPLEADVYDSIGECYRKMGNKDLAIKNYKKSLEMNPNNKNATAMLKEISLE